MGKVCFLFGHRDASDWLLPELEQAVERQYTCYGIRNFIVGGYGNFNRLAGMAVKAVVSI